MGLLSGPLNMFRVAGDLSHWASTLILIRAMHCNRSAEGVSLITQVFYVVVFVARYLDLFWTPNDPTLSRFLMVYQYLGKTFNIVSAAFVVFLMTRVYARTMEREKAWKLGSYCLGVSALLAMPVAALFKNFPLGRAYGFNVSQVLWTFSIILESICVIPQLLLLRQTTVPTVIDSYYLIALGTYRALYIPNWIVRLLDPSHHFDPISVIFGILQTALYIDFFYVYYTRQRVKLRNGGIVDSEDIRQGLLVRRFLTKKRSRSSIDEEEGDEDDVHDNDPSPGNRWGPRGISVSADDGLLDAHPRRGSPPGTQKLADPQAFEDDQFDDDADAPSKAMNKHPDTVGNGNEWR